MVELDVSSVVPLRAYQAASVQLDRAHELLGGAELAWLGTVIDDAFADDGRRRFRADLRLPVQITGHDFSVRKAATVELGPVRRANERLLVEISWRSATLAPLFPVFAGQLTVRSNKLVLEGVYAPPGGRLGIALDRALLGMAAQRTARWFLAVVANALKAAAPAVAQSAGDRNRPGPPTSVSAPQPRNATS